MSIFNEMQAGGYNEVLTRRFALQGAAASPALVPEVGAGLVIENDRPEWSYLMGENLFSHQVTVAAAVGFNSSVALISPASSSTIVVVKRIIATGTGTLALRLLRRGDTSGPALNFSRYGLPRDGRFSGASSSALYVQNAAAVTATAQVLNALSTSEEQPWILKPGDTLLGWNVTANQAISMTYFWTERQAAPGELV